MAERGNGEFREATETRRATFRPASVDERLQEDLDSTFGVTTKQADKAVTRPQTKLERGRVSCEQTVGALRLLVEELDGKMEELAGTLGQTSRYVGVERPLAFLGKTLGITFLEAQALNRKEERVNKLDVGQLTKLLRDHVRYTIEKLEKSKKEFDVAVAAYDASLAKTIDDYKRTQPEYETVLKEQERLSALITELKQNLDAGLIGETERPAKEAELDKLEQQLYEVEKRVGDAVQILKACQESIKLIPENRKAAHESRVAIQQMQREALEKLKHFGVLFEQSMAAVRAQAAVENFNRTAPSYDKGIQAIHRNNVAFAGAAIEVLAKRLQTNTVDPSVVLELIKEIAGHIQEGSDAMKKAEGDIDIGYRTTIAKLLQEDLSDSGASESQDKQ